jgi:hypothetical protein
MPDLTKIVVTDEGRTILIPLNTLREMVLWYESEGHEVCGLVISPSVDTVKTAPN